MWMGGVPPVAYEVSDQKLVVIGSEAETARHIFRRYAARLLGNPMSRASEASGPPSFHEAA